MQHLTTTTELLHALRTGTESPAWDLLLQRYRPVLLGVARRLGLGREDAEDVAQQTLFEFVRDFGLGRYDRSRSRLRTWLLAILRHRVSDLKALRARRGRTERNTEAAGSGPWPDGEVAEVEHDDDALERHWQLELDRQILTQAIEELRVQGRSRNRAIRAFELTVLRDVPIPAAADACGMSVNAVYIARGRIAERLRRRVEDLRKSYDDSCSLE